MKISRYAVVTATLLLAAMAGTSSGDTMRQVACTADTLASLLGNAPAPGSACR